ncbi:MAG: metal ABC transporter permease [Sedimentisphaerales bacterium]
MDSYFYTVMLAGVIAGASTGLLGAFIIGMRMPFIGTCISHASMAGFIYGGLLAFGNSALWPVLSSSGGVLASVVAALSLATIREDKTRLDKNVGLAIVFSFMLGITFLGIGLNQGSRNDMLNLLWGNILFVDKTRTIIIAVLAAVLGIFIVLFNKEMRVLLFSRTIAAATGVHESFVYCLFLTLCGVILAVNLPLVGGLMIFSLITCPAAAAYQVCKGYVPVVIASALFGMISALAGFLFSFYLDLPTGACIVIVSVAIFALATLYKNLTRRYD